MHEYLTKLLEFYNPVKPEMDGTTPLSIHEWSSKNLLGFRLSSVTFLGYWHLHITSYVQITTLPVIDCAGKYWAFLHLGHAISENEDNTINKHLWNNFSCGDIENSAERGPDQLALDDFGWEGRLDLDDDLQRFLTIPTILWSYNSS